MSDPWAFGWAPLLAIIGFIITIVIAVGGFRTFGRWKREKLEERRIETAIEALALVYESKFIFDHIRSEMSFEYEWKDMPDSYGATEKQRRPRGSFYAVFKRIEASKDFFERSWKIQVRCTALFGPEIEEVFLLMHRARRRIEVSSEVLLQDPYPTNESPDNMKMWDQLRADVWPAWGRLQEGGDQVGQMLSEFKEKMENLCRPIIDHEYGKVLRKGIGGSFADWLGGFKP